MHAVRKSKGMEILLSLLSGSKHIRELQTEIGGSASTLEMRIRELLKEGYIKEKELASWPFRKMLTLTEEGRKVAEILKQTGYLASSKEISVEEGRKKGRWILALLHVTGGTIEGSTRLQKMLFLLKREFEISELPYNFLPFLHGPFSSEINYDALDLELAGLLNIGREILEPTLYTLTQEGAKAAKEAYSKMPTDDKRAFLEVKKFNKMDLTKLINHIYTKYPKESKL